MSDFNRKELLFPVNPLSEIFVAYYHGMKVPTTFTNYLVIPTREQFDAFVAEMDEFYQVFSPEDIGTINREAEDEWHRKAYEESVSVRKERPAVNKPKPGYVYLLQSQSGHYKIGLTKNPEHRAKTFGIQLPFEVEFICLIQTEDMPTLETELHTRFADKRVNGEWFNLAPEDVEYIKGLAK